MATYEYWQNALEGIFLPLHDSDPQLGYFRKRTGKAKGFSPVAIWEQDGNIIALVDGKPADAAELWSYVAQHPISEEQYHARMNTGRWHDEDDAVTESLAPPPMGHNAGPTDEAEILKAQIDIAAAGAAEYVQIDNDEASAKAQSLRSRLLELSGEADKKREAQKKPFFEAGKAVDAKFQPLVKAAKAAADAIRDAISAHETRKLREAERLRLEAENIRIKAERGAVKAAAAGKPIPAPAPAPPPEPAPAPQAAIRGSYGRAAAVKVVKVVKVIDQDAAYTFLKTHKELIELIGKLAQRAVDAGYAVPGTEVSEERKVV